MENMKIYVWLLPVLFILHDMEEIIAARIWKSKGLDKKKYVNVSFMPFGTMKSTEDCAIAVYEELLILCGISCYSFFTGQYGLWFGMMAANILHLLIIHIIAMPIVYRAYVPGFITALLTVVPCLLVLYKSYAIMQYGLLKGVLYVAIGTVIAMVNLKVLHNNAYKFSSLF